MSSLSRLLAITVVGAASIALPAQAQQPTDGPPPLTCVKPGDPATIGKSSADVARFNQSVTDYKTCVDLYAKTNNARANELIAQGRAYNDAAQKAVDQFNDFAAVLNAANAADKSKTPAPARK